MDVILEIMILIVGWMFDVMCYEKLFVISIYMWYIVNIDFEYVCLFFKYIKIEEIRIVELLFCVLVFFKFFVFCLRRMGS